MAIEFLATCINNNDSGEERKPTQLSKSCQGRSLEPVSNHEVCPIIFVMVVLRVPHIKPTSVFTLLIKEEKEEDTAKAGKRERSGERVERGRGRER